MRVHHNAFSFIGSRPKALVRVLFLNLSTEIAGGELSLFGMLQYLDRSKYEVHININGPGKFEEKVREIEKRYVFHTRIPRAFRFLARPKSMARMLWQVARLYAYARRHHIDMVHVSHPNTLLIGAMLRSLIGVKLIYHHRSYDTNKLWLLRWLARHFCDKVIAISQSMRDQFIGNQSSPLADQVVNIYNGIDLNLFRPSERKEDAKQMIGFSPGCYIVGIVGRLAPHKGQMLFLQAAKRLLETEAGAEGDYAFYIVGEVFSGDTDRTLLDYKHELLTFVETHRLKPFVHFLDYRPDVWNIMKALDILVVPSAREPFGRVVVEGMACGLPVIVSPGSGGPEEIVQKGVSGVVLQENTPECLARAICELKEDSQLARRIGQAARQRAQEFSVERYVRSVERVYEELVRDKSLTHS
ncbi:glycosyltransferase family 4 protein [Candidatus Poribacteria bacterium]|nr:glycosyltransferase family 4 protein [Candidatus Poribacteria bacterium]